MDGFLKPAPRSIAELRKREISKRFKEGRGQGAGKFYKPFLLVRDVPSKGRSHRVPAITHGRVVHLLSDLELAIFYLFDWNESVIDIREQFPADLKTTQALAEKFNIPHLSVNSVDQVLTTDFVVDLNKSSKVQRVAVSAKYSEELDDTRTIEKQELERRYWESKGIQWYLVTEREIPQTLVKNIKWLIPHYHSFELSESERRSIFEQFCYAFDTYESDKIVHVCASLDQANSQSPGTFLSWLRHLLAQRAFCWDMEELLHTELSSNHLFISPHWEQGVMPYAASE